MRKFLIIAFAASLAACGQKQSASEIAQADAKAEADSMAKEDAAAMKASSGNLDAGKAWMAQNAQVKGVVTLPSGVQYRVLREGPAGGAKPTMSDAVLVNYEGKLIDGKIFDSSYERGEPTDFPLAGVVPGWAEALTHMKPGDMFEVVLPPALAYGPEPKGELPGNSTLIFKIELLRVLPSGPQLG